MNDAKYIGLDVYQATISAAVLDSDGRCDNGIDPRNEGGNDSPVCSRAARKLARHF